MARPGIVYEDVQTAAEQLLSRGEAPSIQRVRQVLGTGSNSTIGGHLKRWQQVLSESPRAALPSAVPEAVMTALEHFWRVAAEQAEAHYRCLREQAAAAVKTAEEARDEAVAQLGHAREEAAALRDRLRSAETAAAELDRRLLLEQERRTQAEQSIASAERQAKESVQAADRLRAEAVSHVEQLRDTLRQSRDDAERGLAQAEQRLHLERERGQASEERLMRIVDQLRTAQTSERRAAAAERANWQERERELRTRLEALQQELMALRVALATTEERGRLLDGELARARTGAQELEARHEEAVRLIEALRGELRAIAAEHEVVARELAACRETLARPTEPGP